jgi:hypothetical protein
VIDDEVDAMFFALIFHVDRLPDIDRRFYHVARNQRAKALSEKPA